MKLETSAHLSAANADELARGLRKVFAHGANLVVGWYLAANGIKILHLPSYALSMTPGFSAESLAPSKFIKKEADFHRLSNMGARVTNTPLSFDISHEANTITAMDRVMRQFSITHYPMRCVSLFDMVGFSKYEPFDKITLITMLSHHIAVAAEKCRQLELPVDVNMTTTGDGFYVWNERVGFGDHFEYFQHHTDARDPFGFIVGDVTIELARMMSATVDNQILIGSHQRSAKDGRIVDTPGFVNLAQSGIDWLIGMQIPGGKIAGIKSYLTGERLMDDDFTVKSCDIIDKHGSRHTCFNSKLNVTDQSGSEIHIGCLDGDLEGFSALASEEADEEVEAKIDEPANG